MNDCEVENSGDFFGCDDLDEEIEEMFAALQVGVIDDNEDEYEEKGWISIETARNYKKYSMIFGVQNNIY